MGFLKKSPLLANFREFSIFVSSILKDLISETTNSEFNDQWLFLTLPILNSMTDSVLDYLYYFFGNIWLGLNTFLGLGIFT